MMARLKTDYSLSEISQALEISPSGFAAHGLKEQRPRRQRDLHLVELMKPLFQRSRGTYGSPRLCAALRQNGERCGKNRINRLMRQQHWKAKQKRRFRPRTTDSRHPMPVAPNRLAQSQEPQKPNEIWQSDSTYIPTQEGWTYLAVTLDRFSRRVVGWRLKSTLETSLVTEALEHAQKERRPPPGLLHHSDRGIQYASSRFQRLLQSFGSEAGMSRKGNCYDNALAESFFATLKTECLGNQIPATQQQARVMVFDYIETFYNPRRLHSALGYKSPVDFENEFH
jgi:transposase InsO family protein